MLKYNLNEAFQMRWLSGVGREEGAFFVALYGTLDNASVLTIPHNDTIPSSSELLKRGQEKEKGERVEEEEEEVGRKVILREGRGYTTAPGDSNTGIWEVR